MKVIVNVNKDTSKLLTSLIDKLNSTKMSELDKSRKDFESMIKELKDQLADSPEKEKLIDFFNEVIEDEEELVTIDKDPNIIDNKTLININTRKMNKKDLIKQELGEIESILKKKAYSQLLAKYHARLFSDVEGLEGEDVEEIKERLDEISDQLEEISNTEVVTDETEESVEVTADTTEEPEATEEVATEEATEETVEEAPAEESTEETEEATEETTEKSTEESESEETKTESEVNEEVLETIEEKAEESDKDNKAQLEKCMAELDEAMEELKEAVETKDFSKVIARAHNRLFSEIEEHEDLIENIDEVKAAMDDLAEKIEKLDAEVDDDESDKHEGEEKEVEDAEKAEEESDDAHEQAEEAEASDSDETKTESEDCWVLVKDGVETSTKGTKEEIKAQLDEFGPADRPHYEMKPCSAKCCSDEETAEEAEVITDDKVEETAEETPKSEVPSTQEIEAIAEQAAEEAVEEYMENGLFMNEVDETIPTVSEEEALINERMPEAEAEVEPLYIDEKTEMVLDPTEEEDTVTESEDMEEMEDEDLYLEGSETEEYCNKTFSKGNIFEGEEDYEKYGVASIEDLLGL